MTVVAQVDYLARTVATNRLRYNLAKERNSRTLANEQFDVTVIGSGPGGYVAAIRAAQLGLKTAIVEKDKRLGGTCGLRGCIPTKQLLMSAHIYEQMQHAADFGVEASGIQLAFANVQKRKDKVVMKNSKGIEYLMKKNKCKVFKGTGKLMLPGKIEVTAEDGSKQTIQTKNIIIATGSVVRPIPGFDTDGKQVVNSDHILELTEVPKSLIVMGCGAVGVEFASVYSRFGAETNIVELLPSIVPLEDEEVSKELERSFRKRGIKSQVDTKLEKLEKTDKGVVVTGKTSKGEEVKLGKFPFRASGKARIIGEEEGFVKVVSETKYDEILGVHIIGPHATELIAEACVAMQLESTAEELGNTMHAHPTVSEAVMEAAEGVHGKTIHI